MPASSAMRAISGAFRCSLSQPVRIFSVTGMSTAATTASRISRTSASSFISAEPAALLHTFLAGHPMLMSMIWAPNSAFSLAALASISGSPPAICTERGSGSPSWFMRVCDLRVCHSLLSAMTISDTASPAPIRRQSRRKGRSVTPAIGATINGLGRVYGPIFAVGSMI